MTPIPMDMAAVTPQFTRNSLGDAEVVGGRNFDVVRRIGNQLDRKAGALADLGVIARRTAIGGDAEPRVGVPQHLPRKSLRRLRAPDALAIHRVQDPRGRAMRAFPNLL